MKTLIKHILIFSCVCISFLLSTQLLGMETSATDSTSLEIFGNNPLNLEEINAFIDAVFPIKLRYYTIEFDHYAVKTTLKEMLNNYTDHYYTHPVTYAYIWKEYIEKPLNKFLHVGKRKINQALKEWVHGYIGDHNIISSLRLYLQDYEVLQTNANQITAWLLYQIDKTY